MIGESIGVPCPKCKRPLRETYSTEIGFCPHCSQQFKI